MEVEKNGNLEKMKRQGSALFPGNQWDQILLTVILKSSLFMFLRLEYRPGGDFVGGRVFQMHCFSLDWFAGPEDVVFARCEDSCDMSYV